MKKYFIRLLTMWILTISLILTFNTAVYAGSSNIFPGVSRSCVIKGYCYRVHDVSRKRVNVYYNESCSSRNSREYVSAQTDECYITGTSGGYNNVRITYPTSSGRKERWTIMGVFTSATSCSIRYATAKIPTYKFASTRYGYGSISRNDQVRVYETWRGYVRVVYPISGGYKIAWITEANANRYLSGYSNAGYVNISEGTYKITTALNTGYALDVNNYATFNGGNVEIYPYHDTNNEKWRITSVGNGYYRITDVNSGKPLDVSGGGSASGTNVQIWESNNTNAQKWRFINAGNGYYYIVNANGCYLDVQNGTVQNGNNVWVYSGNGSNAQKWRLTGVSVSQNNNSNNNSNNSSGNGLTSPVPSGAKFNRKTNDGKWYGYHDINRGVYRGTPVYAIADGTIRCKQAYRTFSGVKNLTSYGNYIEFTSDSGGYTAKYCHLNSFRDVNQIIPSYRTRQVSGSAGSYVLTTRHVRKGEIIGYIGSTGNASGVHLHFELRKNGVRIDPTSVISGLV